MEAGLRNRSTQSHLKEGSSEGDQTGHPNSTPTRIVQFDANGYASRQTFANNCLNVALMTCNAKQLKKLAMLGPDQQTYHSQMVALVCVSIVLQSIMGVLKVVVGRVNINEGDDKKKKASALNNGVACIALIVTVINIVVSTFIV